MPSLDDFELGSQATPEPSITSGSEQDDVEPHSTVEQDSGVEERSVPASEPLVPGLPGYQLIASTPISAPSDSGQLKKS